jgi:hypothetical protein
MIEKTITKENAFSIFQQGKCPKCGDDLPWTACDGYSYDLCFEAICCGFAHILTPQATEYSHLMREDPYEP